MATYFDKGKFVHTTELNTLWMALVIGLHSVNEQQLVFRAVPVLSQPLTTLMTLIDLDAPSEYLILVALEHDLLFQLRMQFFQKLLGYLAVSFAGMD
ncbi:hypothetical protein HCU01_42660 [Halomonas cupida]|uniref:Uncharacterized protein n=1 Tax=Halomonas cupida TaxID=44933 RepID=A0A1M7MJB5_9GAMM|nr:hypothetical protein [Halomonas cupida]GEN26317.1 hypothetical protein HCU01_42660 [Halomonas cupida]SHM90968.1 hypothetical protein SAMN05660971_04224 [Halomonas cupida]